MATLQAIRIRPQVAGMLTVALATALLIGGTGGYMVRGLTLPASASAGKTIGLASHLRTATAAKVPDWVQRYTAPATAPRFRVDEMLEDLSYAGTTGTVAQAELPEWVQRYTAPAVAPRFRVDEMIEELSYAGRRGALARDELPEWVLQYISATR